MEELRGSSEEQFFEKDVQKIQNGYRMLDDIERKLKGYLEKTQTNSPNLKETQK